MKSVLKISAIVISLLIVLLIILGSDLKPWFCVIRKSTKSLFIKAVGEDNITTEKVDSALSSLHKYVAELDGVVEDNQGELERLHNRIQSERKSLESTKNELKSLVKIVKIGSENSGNEVLFSKQVSKQNLVVLKDHLISQKKTLKILLDSEIALKKRIQVAKATQQRSILILSRLNAKKQLFDTQRVAALNGKSWGFSNYLGMSGTISDAEKNLDAALKRGERELRVSKLDYSNLSYTNKTSNFSENTQIENELFLKGIQKLINES